MSFTEEAHFIHLVQPFNLLHFKDSQPTVFSYKFRTMKDEYMYVWRDIFGKCQLPTNINASHFTMETISKRNINKIHSNPLRTKYPSLASHLAKPVEIHVVISMVRTWNEHPIVTNPLEGGLHFPLRLGFASVVEHLYSTNPSKCKYVKAIWTHRFKWHH